MRAQSETQIRAFTEKEKVRNRPDVWLQSHDINAVKHTVIEIIGNSIDEAVMGFGKKIVLKRYKDNSLEVIDNGRGIPMDWNENEQKYNWELIFLQLFAGGKYDEEAYEMSVGLNGVGLTVVQYLSEYMNVEVKRNGKKYSVDFKSGDPVTDLIVEELEDKTETGTRIRWLPDKEVFTDTVIEDEWFLPVLRGMALSSGVTFVFEDEITGESQVIETGDYKHVLQERNAGKAISDYVFLENSGIASDTKNGDKPYKYDYKLAFVFTEKDGRSQYFHNMIEVDKQGRGGAHSNAVYHALAKSLSETLERQIVVKDMLNLSNRFSVLIFTRSTQSSYDGQAKRLLINKGIENVLRDALTVELTKLFQKSKELRDYFKRILEIHEKAQEAEKKIEKHITKIREKINELDDGPIDKFADCKAGEGRELYIVEGDSAFGACLQARDSDHQAITSVRGKIKNCLKADVSQISSNDIILRLIKIINEPVEMKGVGRVTLGNIREWEKIIICTDADEDGFQIRTLILTALYRLYPTMMREGKVYIAESPLFEIEYGNNTAFAYTNEEKDEIVKKLDDRGVRYEVNRSKGLGENNPDMMWQTTMCPSTRRLVQVRYNEEEHGLTTREAFDALLGDDLESRKILISDYMRNLNMAEVLS